MQFIKTICASAMMLLSLLFLSFQANSANLILENPSSQFPTLLGVEDLVVNDATYNVYFGRGTFNTLYLGVNSDPNDPIDRVRVDRVPFEFDISLDLFDNDPFVFETANDALDATNAFVDAALDGTVFDERPGITNGCSAPSVCNIFTPYGEIGDTLDGRVDVLLFANFNFESEGSDGTSISTLDPDFRTNSTSTYALWFLTSGGEGPGDPAPVPLPPSVIAFLSGLFVFLNLSKSVTGRR